MEHVYHVKLGDSRRIALPAKLCRKHGLHPGDHLVIAEEGERLSLSSLRGQAEQMRQELRPMLGDGSTLTESLKKLRRIEAAGEAPRR